MKQKIQLRCQTFDLQHLANLFSEVKRLSALHKLSFSSIRLPVKKKIYTVLRSPHVNKKAKDQFEIRLHNYLIILKADRFSIDFLSALKKSFKAGVSIKILSFS